MKKEKVTKRIDDWWPNSAPAGYDMYQESKPKLTQEEIQELAFQQENIKKYTMDKEIKKIIAMNFISSVFVLYMSH